MEKAQKKTAEKLAYSLSRIEVAKHHEGLFFGRIILEGNSSYLR